MSTQLIARVNLINLAEATALFLGNDVADGSRHEAVGEMMRWLLPAPVMEFSREDFQIVVRAVVSTKSENQLIGRDGKNLPKSEVEGYKEPHFWG